MDAGHITSLIIDTLTRYNFALKNCVGQAYDGAATMSGQYSGVAKHISDVENRCIYVHCSARNLNLCLQDICKTPEPVKSALDLTSEIVNVVRNSPKRLALFEEIRKAQPSYS